MVRGQAGTRGGKLPRIHTVGGPVTIVSHFKPSDVAEDVLASKLTDFQKDWDALEQEDISSADYYFNSYAHFGIHEEMLKDSVRTGAYQKAIMDNPHLFKDKIVLDVGAGTGVLSMFAAKAGAKHVYGIECSEIVHVARKVIAQNRLDGVITMIQAKAEEAVLPVDKVDIIISEWMGYFLLYESMLDTVLYCRDKWLAPNGLIFPDKATLHLAALEDGDYKKEKFDFWDSAYGLDYSVCKKVILEEPTVDTVSAEAVSTDACCILELDLYTCTTSDVDFAAPFRLRFKRKDYAHAFVAWFDCTFSACHVPVVFSTGPASYYTHWKQTVFYLEEVVIANKNEEIRGLIAVRKNSKNPRDLDIKLAIEFEGQIMTSRCQQFHRLR